MGALAITWFCRNGHIVENIPHGYVSYDDPKQCPYCKSTELASEYEWGDSDYGPDIVPYKPLRHEEHVMRIPVYDVSKLFGRKRKLAVQQRALAR